MLERHGHTIVFAYLFLTVGGGMLMALLGFTVVRS
jgi:hypothetical protein